MRGEPQRADLSLCAFWRGSLLRSGALEKARMHIHPTIMWGKCDRGH